MRCSRNDFQPEEKRKNSNSKQWSEGKKEMNNWPCIVVHLRCAHREEAFSGHNSLYRLDLVSGVIVTQTYSTGIYFMPYLKMN